jgi:chorismate-pyruvate lyase
MTGVDVVDTDTRPSDHAQLRRCGEHLGRDLRLAADDERVVVADALAEHARLETCHHVHLACGAQTGHAILSDRVGNKDARHSAGCGARFGGDAHPTVTGSA